METHFIIIIALLALILIVQIVSIYIRIRHKRNELDWSLVFPELTGLGAEDEMILQNKSSVSQLDQMLSEKSDAERLIELLKEGLKTEIEDELRREFENRSSEITNQKKQKIDPSKEKSAILDQTIENIDADTDKVSCSVYAPGAVEKGEEFILYAFAHLIEQKTEVESMAKDFDENLIRKALKTLATPVLKGEKLTFNLQIKNWDIKPETQTLVWDGNPEAVEFVVSVPDDFNKKSVIGKIVVSYQSVPIGHINFTLKITDNGVQINYNKPAQTNAKRYKFAFVSYSSKDRTEVLKRTQMLKKVGINFFQDVLDLEPGDRWNKELYKNITKCDVFFLFWSKSAKKSEWVTKEWLYALEKQTENAEKLPEIIPVPLEGPPPVSPPDELKHLHFNDKFGYFIKN